MVGILEKYPGLQRTRMDNECMAFMRGGNNMFISMFQGKASYPEMSHIGFTQETEAEVNAIYRRLTADGFAPDAPQDDRGRWTLDFRSPPGVVNRSADVPPDLVRAMRRLEGEITSSLRFRIAWRRERDSNSWYSFPYTRFPGVLLKPLGHLSIPLERGGVYQSAA